MGQPLCHVPSQQKILFLGAGSAGIGIANLIASVMVQEGLSLQEAQSQIALFDIHGLIESKRKEILDFQKPYAHAMPYQAAVSEKNKSILRHGNRHLPFVFRNVMQSFLKSDKV
jgi:malic enzyme